jgi:hypothetical protein
MHLQIHKIQFVDWIVSMFQSIVSNLRAALLIKSKTVYFVGHAKLTPEY